MNGRNMKNHAEVQKSIILQTFGVTFSAVAAEVATTLAAYELTGSQAITCVTGVVVGFGAVIIGDRLIKPRL